MSLFTRSSDIIAPDRALKGRAEAIPTAPLSFINQRPLKGPYPEGLEVAHVAMGIYWQTPGVWVTAVGYMGGFTPNPTYEETCSGRTGHTETVRIVFDPAQVTYEALLKFHPPAVDLLLPHANWSCPPPGTGYADWLIAVFEPRSATSCRCRRGSGTWPSRSGSAWPTAR